MQAGGLGMILLNVSPNSINADLHYVPSIHLSDTACAAVHARGTRGQDGDDLEAHARLQRAGSVHRLVLVARADRGGRRRHPEAGHHRPGPGHPRGRRASGQRLAVTSTSTAAPRCPARTCRPRRAPAPGASRLVADDDQVGVHDDYVYGSPNDYPRCLPLGRGPRRPEQGRRSGPRLRQQPHRLARAFLKGQGLHYGLGRLDQGDPPQRRRRSRSGRSPAPRRSAAPRRASARRARRTRSRPPACAGLTAKPSVSSFTAAPGSATTWQRRVRTHDRAAQRLPVRVRWSGRVTRATL